MVDRLSFFGSYFVLLLTIGLNHNFSANPGTYDGAPVCNGSNGTNGSIRTGAIGIVVTNFTSTTASFRNFSLANTFTVCYKLSCPQATS
jgi:hypothetical protein